MSINSIISNPVVLSGLRTAFGSPGFHTTIVVDVTPVIGTSNLYVTPFTVNLVENQVVLLTASVNYTDTGANNSKELYLQLAIFGDIVTANAGNQTRYDQAGSVGLSSALVTPQTGMYYLALILDLAAATMTASTVTFSYAILPSAS